MPKILTADPILAKARVDKADPTCAQSSKLNEEPILPIPYTEHAEPILQKVRTLMLDPICKKSSTDMREPYWDMP
jgi:hypothetical protein